MRRTTLQYPDDILEAADRIERYIKNTSFEEFSSDTMRSDAVIRNFEVIATVDRFLERALACN